MGYNNREKFVCGTSNMPRKNDEAGEYNIVVAYITVTGPIDPEYIVDAIQDGWNGVYQDVNGKTVTVVVNIITRENAAGRSILFRTSNDSGVTGADPMNPWVRGYCGVSIYRKYASGYEKDDELLQFSIRHEFAHVLGIGDYYAGHHNDDFPSVTSGKIGEDAIVTNKDIEMMLISFSTGQWIEWP